jgi:hypothetical protein
MLSMSGLALKVGATQARDDFVIARVKYGTGSRVMDKPRTFPENCG